MFKENAMTNQTTKELTKQEKSLLDGYLFLREASKAGKEDHVKPLVVLGAETYKLVFFEKFPAVMESFFVSKGDTEEDAKKIAKALHDAFVKMVGSEDAYQIAKKIATAKI